MFAVFFILTPFPAALFGHVFRSWNQIMKNRSHLYLLLSALLIAFVPFSGCSQTQLENRPPSTPAPTRTAQSPESENTEPDSPSEESTLGAIERIEQVPDGVSTESGLTVPQGFKINVFAQELTNPRRIAFAPGATPQRYDVFVAESRANRVRLLRESNGDGHADDKIVFVQGLNRPYGIAFWNDWIYIGNTDAVVRFPYKKGESTTTAKAQQIAALTQGRQNQHWTRNLLFSRDGEKLYVATGSSCNTCEESDPQRAAITEMDPDGKNRRLFATGLRNPVGMDWQPGTGELWTVVNERDRLGDDIPPDYFTRAQSGSFYGWPYAYTDLERNIIPDPEFGRKQPEKVKASMAATVPLQAHSAALGMAFYPTEDTKELQRSFPAEYSGDAFLAFHGSWNRSDPTGYKIVRVHFQNGTPVKITDFVTGFLKDGDSWGRPVDIQVAPDGSLLFSDDKGGKIWRVSAAS